MNLHSQAVDSLLKVDSSLTETLSHELARQILDLMVYKLASSGSLDQDLTESLKLVLQRIPVTEWEVFRPLNGASCQGENPAELGPFRVFSHKTYVSYIKNTYPHAVDEFKRRLESRQTLNEAFEILSKRTIGAGRLDLEPPGDSCVISVSVKARDAKKAVELADARFMQFDNIIPFLLHILDLPHVNRNVFVLEYSDWEFSEHWAVSNTHADGGFEGQVVYDGLDFGSTHLTTPGSVQEWIWKALREVHPGEISKRVINALEWAGKGIRDRDPAKALTQHTFALESLLTFEERGLIKPAIVSSIAELAAYIVGEDYTSRVQTEKTVKRVYTSRSAVVHGGSRSVTRREAQEALDLLTGVIMRITTSPELRSIGTMKTLREWVERKKYG